MTLRNQLNQLSVTRWPLKPKVWQWVPGRPIRKMQVSRFSGTAAPSTTSLFKCLCKDVQHLGWRGHLPNGHSGVPPVLARAPVISQQHQIMFAKDTEKGQELISNEYRQLCPTSLFASLAQRRPQLVLPPVQGDRQKPAVPAGSWATNAGGTLSSLMFQDCFSIAKPPSTCHHWLKSKKCKFRLCVSVQTQIIMFEGNSANRIPCNGRVGFGQENRFGRRHASSSQDPYVRSPDRGKCHTQTQNFVS